jgi:hypothetical protein
LSDEPHQDTKRLLLKPDAHASLAQLARAQVGFEDAEADDIGRRVGRVDHDFTCKRGAAV